MAYLCWNGDDSTEETPRRSTRAIEDNISNPAKRMGNVVNYCTLLYDLKNAIDIPREQATAIRNV